MDNVACHFVYYSGPRKGDAENFHTARITIGKAGSNDFRLDPTADQVGSHHAEILLEEGGVYCLYDLGSKAGTYVNGERVHERCVLMNEDYIRFSQDGPEIIFRTGEAVPGKQRLPLVFPVTAELEFFSGSDAGRIFPINAAVTTNIGRRTELEIPLDPRGDMIVSGNHCNIRYVDGHFVLTDSSRNGTYVNGDLVEQPMEIIDSDVIMLGDGGPQARFRVDLAKRHYPNHRPLSPVIKPAKPETPSVSAMSSAPAVAAAPPAPAEPLFPDVNAESPDAAEDVDHIDTPQDAIQPSESATPAISAAAAAAAAAALSKPLASAAPFASGSPQSSGLVGPAAKPGSAPAGDDDATTATDSGAMRSGLADEVVSASDSASEASAKSPGTPKATKKNLPFRAPFKHKLEFQPGKKLIFAAIAIVALIALIAILSSGDDSESGSGASRGDYAAALEKLKKVDSTNGFSVKIPEAWTSLADNGNISAESADKELALDYLRDSRLSEDKVRQMLGKKNAVVKPDAKHETVNGTKITTLEATVGSVHRIAALHQPASGPAAVALLETTEDAFKKLDKKTLDQFLVKNLTLAQVAAPSAVTPPPAPVADAPLPTPAGASKATPVPTAKAASTPAPTKTPSPTPAPTASPAADAASSATAQGKTVSSKALKVSVSIPDAWTGVSEEADAMLTLADKDGLEIRIARDEGDLDPKGTFDAMVKEGWKRDGVKTDPRFQAAQFSKSNQFLLLVLIPEKSKTTLVIYATSSKTFSDEQRTMISNIITQIVPEEG